MRARTDIHSKTGSDWGVWAYRGAHDKPHGCVLVGNVHKFDFKNKTSGVSRAVRVRRLYFSHMGSAESLLCVDSNRRHVTVLLSSGLCEQIICASVFLCRKYVNVFVGVEAIRLLRGC